MAHTAKNLVKSALSKLDVGITRMGRLRELQRRDQPGRDMELLQQMPPERGAEAFKLLSASKSQLRQDIFALSELGFPKNGFFVEFGAADGVYLSNTYLMEQMFGWNGILAEPARRWQGALLRNRSCSVETDCVWRESGSTLTFTEADEGEYSTINSFSDSDFHGKFRKSGNTYEVKTISLNELLDKYNAPERIDYLSIDTEGSEYDILSRFDFRKRQFNVITVEHNWGPMRDKIHALLTRHGYVRKLETLSFVDDWYVLPA